MSFVVGLIVAMLLGKGVYSFSDAAKYTGLRSARVREWFGSIRSDRVFLSDFGNETQQKLISFNDLIEVFIAGQMRERGASLKAIRNSHEILSHKWHTKHPFCRREVCVHQGRVLYLNLQDDDRAEVLDVLSAQRLFSDVILPFLKRLDYDQATKAATLWHIADGVELNPQICFGKPIASVSKKPTYLLSAAYLANGRNEDAVARWYGVPTDDVKAAVAFEASMSA